MVKLVPEAKLEPPVGEAYQLIVPADATAVKVTVPGKQRLAGVAVTVGIGFTVAVTVVLVAVVQPFAVAST